MRLRLSYIYLSETVVQRSEAIRDSLLVKRTDDGAIISEAESAVRSGATILAAHSRLRDTHPVLWPTFPTGDVCDRVVTNHPTVGGFYAQSTASSRKDFGIRFLGVLRLGDDHGIDIRVKIRVKPHCSDFERLLRRCSIGDDSCFPAGFTGAPQYFIMEGATLINRT